MSQKELCARSLEALKSIKENADQISKRCDDMKLIFSDTNNFSYVEYLEGFAGKLEQLKEGIVPVNSQLLSVYTQAAAQKQISNQHKKK